MTVNSFKQLSHQADMFESLRIIETFSNYHILTIASTTVKVIVKEIVAKLKKMEHEGHIKIVDRPTAEWVSSNIGF